MQTVKLTDAAVRRLRAPTGWRVEYFDAELPGFGLRVEGPTGYEGAGKKYWVLLYPFNGEQRRLSLAMPYPALSLAKARREACVLLQLAAQGIDPAVDAFAPNELTASSPAGSLPAEVRVSFGLRSATVGLIVDKFLASGAVGRQGRAHAPTYLETIRGSFENHILPRWRERDVAAITRRDVLALCEAIAKGRPVPGRALEGRKRHPRGGPAAAARVSASLRAMFDWAHRSGIVEINPCM